MVDRRSFISAMGMVGIEAMLPLELHSAPREQETHKLQVSEKQPRRGIQFTADSFEIDGKKVFLVSGEMHYFRVPRAAWRLRMKLFQDAGGNCLATYIPWAVHEPQPREFIFQTGDGIHDLEDYLEEANRIGLYVIARPGPYVGSELLYGGLPAWFCENHPEAEARGIDGKTLGTGAISYLHPVYLEKVREWFRHVCPIVARHTIQRGGPVAMLQLDNELMGLHLWRGSLDYNADSMGLGKRGGRYPKFLEARYSSVVDLNDAYATHFKSFEAVTPIAPAACTSLYDLRRAKDFFSFYLGTTAEYVGILADQVREHDIGVPLIHNSGGPDMNVLYLETAQAQGKGFLLGTDHYYNLGQDWGANNPSPQSVVKVFCSLEILRVLGYPPTVLEMQGGSCWDWPPIHAEDCAAWYWTNLAYGMKGSNYYVFTGGPNPPGLGETSDSYDYGAAVGASGEIRPLYAVQTEFGHFLRDNAWLAQSQREYDFHLGFDSDNGRAAQYWKYTNAQIFSYAGAWEFTQKGVLTSAFCANLSPAFFDLDADNWSSLEHAPLVVPTSSCMATAKQQRIVRFLKNGGCVLIAPTIPVYDDSLRPSTVLSDFLGRPVLKNERRDVVRINIAGIQNLVSNGTVFTTTTLPVGAMVIGTDERTGSVVAWQLTTEGGGKVIFLGMSWMHGMRGHQNLLETLLRSLGLKPKIMCSNPALWTSLRTYGNKSALFVINLFSSAVEADVACQPGSHDRMLQLGHHRLAPMSVKYLPI